MAGKNTMPLLLAGGAALLILGGKKSPKGTPAAKFDAATQANQINLKVLGYEADLDGMRPLGPKSILAIQAFQKDAGLLPTGVFDTHTTAAIQIAVQDLTQNPPNAVYTLIMSLIQKYGAKTVEGMKEIWEKALAEQQGANS